MKSFISKVIVFIGVSFCLAPTAFSKTLVLNFAQCADMALHNNEQIKAADQDIKLSKAKLSQAKPGMIPVVKYEHRLAPVPGDIDDSAGSFFGGDISIFNNFKIEMGSAVSSFGKIKTAQELAKIGINASWFQKSKKADEIILKTYQIYQGILLARELNHLTDEATDAIQKKVKALENDQVKDQLTILKLKIALIEIQKQSLEAKKNEKLALEALKVQLNLDPTQNIALADGTLTRSAYSVRSLDYYLQKSKSSMPDYKLLQAGVSAKEKQIKLEKLNYAPNLGVGAFFDVGRAPGITGGGDENNFTNPFNFTKAGIGLQLKGELDVVKTKSKINQAKADYLQTSYKRNAALQGLELDVKKTYLTVQQNKTVLDYVSEEKKSSRQMVFLTKSNMDIGVGDQKDYVDALQSYMTYQGYEYQAIYNYNVALSELRAKAGDFYNTTSISDKIM
ncbi:TolC family protein [bacterium]|nr:TolC family protein [bacterium]